MHLKRQKLHIRSLLIVASLTLSFFLFAASSRIYQSGKSLYEQIRVFSAVMKQIDQEYVDETDPEILLEHAIKGMVSQLDPHTTFYTSEQFSKWNQSYEGYSGIGVTFDVINDKITIMSVIEGGPSAKAGLQTGDRIVEIEGVSAIGLKEEDVPLRLMGPKGTLVNIGVERRLSKHIKQFTIMRDEVHVESIPYAFMMKPGVGYIRIVRFSATTSEELEAALKQLEQDGLRQLVLDLRGNGGGYLEAAVDVVDRFLPGGQKIVYTRGRIETAFREFYSTHKYTHPLMPVIVLIDRATASASEIVAGALQDWDRALIVGETSFGKGLVQSQYQFSDGSALLMTTAKYYTPSGRLIQRPYQNKSSDDYFSEIYDDAIHGKNNQLKKEGPVFHTNLLRREVRGGGGITPDIFFNAESDTFSEKIRDLVLSPKQLFFTFVEQYLRSSNQVPRNFNQFLRDYLPDNACMKLFIQYIQQQGYLFSKQDYLQYQQDIRYFLKQSIAESMWGETERYKVQLLRDKQLMEAVAYFEEAQSLLAQGYGYTVGSNTRRR